MAVDTPIKKFRNRDILEEHAKKLREYLNSLPIKWKNTSDIPKENERMNAEFRQLFETYAFSTDLKQIDKAFHDLKHRFEHEMRERAGETEVERQKAAETGNQGPARADKKAQEERQQKPAADSKKIEIEKEVIHPTPEVRTAIIAKADQQAASSKHAITSIANAPIQKTPRGGRIGRAFVGPKMRTTSFYLKAIKQGLKTGYTEQAKKNALAKANKGSAGHDPLFEKLVALGKPEVNAINKPLEDRMRAEKEIEKLGEEHGRSEIRKLTRPYVEKRQQDPLYQIPMDNWKANKRAQAEVAAINRGEEFEEVEEETYEERGGRTLDRRRLGNTRAEPPSSRPQLQQQRAPTNDAGGGDGGGRPPSKIQRGGFGKNAKRASKTIDNARKLAQLASRVAQLTSQLVGFFSTPAGWFTLGAIALLIIILILVFIFSDDAKQKANEKPPCSAPQETLHVDKTKGPDTAVDGQPLDYEFTVTDSVPMQELTIVIRLPEGINLDPTTIKSSWTKFIFVAEQ